MDGKFFVMTKTVIRYIALMMHPGLVTPTKDERCMQIAYTAKFNSGCISRQVGAVVTDSDYSIKSVGWNDAPYGQVACLLRNLHDLVLGNDIKAFSDYELKNDDFRKEAQDFHDRRYDEEKLDGRTFSFCFKTIFNKCENQKNQVHTRSLHAEENAFLQIAKYGGQGIKGGVLYVTASPCELCSKKAYQLGIERIVYIDLYPGIAQPHILQCGIRNIKVDLFNGAIGQAYHQLYEPVMSFKDELTGLLDDNIKTIEKLKSELHETMVKLWKERSSGEDTPIIYKLVFDLRTDNIIQSDLDANEFIILLTSGENADEKKYETAIARIASHLKTSVC